MGPAKIRIQDIALSCTWLFISEMVCVYSAVQPYQVPDFEIVDPRNFTTKDKFWLFESLHPDTVLFEPNFLQNFFINIGKHASSSGLEKREFLRKPRCYDEMVEMREIIQKALRIKCELFVAGGVEENLKGEQPTECVLPFKYRTGEDHTREYHSCKPYEKAIDQFIGDPSTLKECPFGLKECPRYWCPTEVDNKTKEFDPAKHGYRACHPKKCTGVENVCLSKSMRLCHFPYGFKSIQLKDPRPVKHQ